MKQASLLGIFMSLAMALCVNAQAQIKWDMATPYSDSNFHTQNIRLFAEDVKKASGGKIEILVRSNGSMFKMPEIKRAVQSDQIQLGEILLSAYANEDPMFEVDTIPFLVQGYDQAKKLHALSKPYIEARLRKTRLVPLFYVAWPGQGILSKGAFAKVEDMKGSKFRASSPTTASFATLTGAVPAIIQSAEIAQAFSTGTVDSTMTSIATVVELQAWQFTKFFYDVRAMHSRDVVFINEKSFSSLSDDLKKVVLEAAAKAETRGWEMSAEVSRVANDKATSNGLTIQAANPAFNAQLREIGKKMTAQWAAKAGADGDKLLKSLADAK